MGPLKIVFFGTPLIAAKFLEELSTFTTICLCVSRPDKPKGRGNILQAPEAKILSLKNNINVIQPEKFGTDIEEEIKKLKPDIGVVVAYGKLIPRSIFSIPRFGTFNVHFSLLPKYRGAAPIERAIINGEKESGVSTFFLEETLDSGPLIVQKKIEILPTDDSITLKEKLTDLGLAAMKESIDCLTSVNCHAKPQEGEPSFAPQLKKEEGRINWNLDAAVIVNLVRGTKPWPGAYTMFSDEQGKGSSLKILACENYPAATGPQNAINGEIIGAEKNIGFIVKCTGGALLVKEVHPQDKKAMSAWSFLQGKTLKIGSKFDKI